MAKFFARPESFGGVLFEISTESLFFLDQFGFEAFTILSDGMSSADLINHSKNQFPPEDHSAATSRIQSINRFLKSNSRTAEDIQRLSGNIGSRVPALSAPLDLYWEITRRCNEQCIHCYNNSSPNGHHADINYIDAIIDELSGSYLKNITITGGEPMMRRDFWHITERLRDVTYELSMGTNATLINTENVKRVAENFTTLNISLDDPDPESFDKFRGYRGAFERTWSALKLLSNENIRINLQTVLTCDSVDRLDDLGELLSDIKVDNWVVRFAFESGRAKDGNNYLTGREIFEKSDYLAAIKERYQTAERQVTIGSHYPWSYKEKYPYVPPTDSHLQTCAAATTHAAIDAFGRMAPCSLFTETSFKTASVFGGSFLKTWREASQFEEMRTLKRSEVKGCGTCANAASICGGGCRAKAYMRYETIRTNDYACNYSQHH